MKTGFVLLFFCGFLFQLSSGNALTDQQRLERFYISMSGPHWHFNTNWMNNSVNVCKWYGVRCTDQGNVNSLQLYSNNLVGYFDPEAFSGWKLQSLDFSQNDGINGEIIPEIFQPSLLSFTIFDGFGLTGMDFKGENNATSLLNIYIRNTRIPQIPPEIFTSPLTNFAWRGTRNNSPIPTEIGNCKTCNNIHIELNGFSGPIPTEIGNLEQIIQLTLSNKLYGTIPSELGKLQQLEYLDLHGNSLFGSIPTELGHLGDNIHLDFHDNHLNCTIEDLNLDFFSANQLDLSQNHITGTLPNNFANKINHFSLSHNFINGVLPTTMGTNLSYLALDNNFLSGTLPSEVSNLQHLHHLHLQSNSFEGTIPSELSKLQTISTLDLSHNQFEGTIPVEILSGDGYINLLNFSHNSLTGELQIPPSALHADFSYNSLSGSLPRNSNCSYPRLHTLNLTHNSFKDTLDIFLTNPCFFEIDELILNSNFFYGTIPSPGMDYSRIDFGNNSLTGTIPQVNVDLKFGNFSHNSFSGSIPSQLFVGPLDVSFNSLSGSFSQDVMFYPTEILMNNNNLIGDIPQWFCADWLDGFNATNNHFSCPVPQCCTPDICDLCA